MTQLVRILSIGAGAVLLGMVTCQSMLSEPSAERALQRAAEEGLSGDFASGITMASEVIDREPSHAMAYVIRGTAYRRAGEYAKAIADLDKAIELDGQIADAYTQRAFAYQQSDVPDAAGRVLADASRAIELDSSNALSFIMRGQAHASLGDPQAAIADFDEALRQNPASYSALANRAAIYASLERLPEARRDLLRTLDLNPPAADRAQIEQLLQSITE